MRENRQLVEAVLPLLVMLELFEGLHMDIPNIRISWRSYGGPWSIKDSRAIPRMEKKGSSFKDPCPVVVPEILTAAQYIRYCGNPCKAQNHHYHHAHGKQGPILRISSKKIFTGPGLGISRLNSIRAVIITIATLLMTWTLGV